MGHYLSEMQSDPVETPEYLEWRKVFLSLQKAIANLDLSRVVAEDLPDIIFVVSFPKSGQRGGRLYDPIILPPDGSEKAVKTAQVLLAKYTT